ncbi:hypothetical protein G6L68_25285 [Agrobacterium fabrum]|uniref:DUF6634 family protein n=1 Tax=Agrobacterium fabrum TaxID=1176649 RepID=UPI000EF5CFA4|nr:DUF6634 family protein [Agrobacterium fabrum]AYM66202.1 hypothetical protein At12D13_50500 [Agrobacterium fabrum]NTE63948.1 hypothetical protein [Agrobacterium fabrum]
MIEQFNGPVPTEGELSTAPVVERWQIHAASAEWAIGESYVQGFVSGHPRFANGTFVTTSQLKQIDPSQPPCWMRSANRVYRLATSAGAVESQVRELACEFGASPRSWDIVAYARAIEELSGQPERDIDTIEQFIAVLFRGAFITPEAGKILLTTYRKERAEC